MPSVSIRCVFVFFIVVQCLYRISIEYVQPLQLYFFSSFVEVVCWVYQFFSRVPSIDHLVNLANFQLHKFRVWCNPFLPLVGWSIHIERSRQRAQLFFRRILCVRSTFLYNGGNIVANNLPRLPRFTRFLWNCVIKVNFLERIYYENSFDLLYSVIKKISLLTKNLVANSF